MGVGLNRSPGKTYDRGSSEEPLKVFNKSFVQVEKRYSKERIDFNNNENFKVANESSSNTISVKVPNA